MHVRHTNYTMYLYLFKRRIVGPVVECPTTDPKVVGSNPRGADIGLYVFHKPHDLFNQEAFIESYFNS